MATAQAITSPYAVVQSLFASTPTLDSFDTRVSSHFAALFADPTSLAQIPLLTSHTRASNLPQPGTLVRFRAMVQDTGVGTEVYQAVGRKGEILVFGMEEEVEEEDEGDAQPTMGAAEDYSTLRERQAFYVISVPGETVWVKERLDQASSTPLHAAVAAISLSDCEAPSAVATVPLLSNKFPIPQESHFGCIAKVYGDAAEKIKTSDVLDFIGILGETPLSSPFDDLVNGSVAPVTTPVPALHVLFTLPPSRPPLPVLPATATDRETLRDELVAYLADGLGGDTDAAEWVLIALLARIHTRHPTGIALGSLSLNLSLPAQFTTTLVAILTTLLPTLSCLELSIPLLNDIQTRMAPRNREENLESGALQLASGTTVVVDTRGIGEGKLGDAGVRNLRHVTTTIATQKLSYQFPYSSFELETDLGFIVLSEGKALIPTDCVVYVKPSSTFSHRPKPSSARLDNFRAFVATMKTSPFDIPPEMSEIIQGDFVERRQKSVGGEAMSQEDLLFRMTAARLMALSLGRAGLDKDAWIRTAELDERRKDSMVKAVA